MFREKLTWILDKVDMPSVIKDDALYQQNIDFVHSLGLKCDPVGWCEMDLGNPKTEEILHQIEQFCRTNGWKARGWYKVCYEETDCEWYELTATYFKDHTVADRMEIPCKNGMTDTLPTIYAYREAAVSPKERVRSVFVPERFVNALRETAEKAATFCRLKDVGKYAAEQYFAIYPSSAIAHIGVDWKMRRKSDTLSPDIRAFYPGNDDTLLPFSWKFQQEDSDIVTSIKGYLPKLTKLFYQLNINLPTCYLAEDMPREGIAVAHYFQHKNLVDLHQVLIHKALAKKLLDAKAISEKHLRPAMIVDRFPVGYLCLETTEAPRPTDEFIAKNQAEYQAFLQTPRPVRRVSEQDALKQLRAAKRERKDDFQKAFPKAKVTELMGTEHEALLPYYQIANGGYLNDEYELLCYTSSLAATEEFKLNMQKEELLTEKPTGIVIAKCPDGDKVLLCTDKAVIRFSHEEPMKIETWSSLPQFIFETTSENI